MIYRYIYKIICTAGSFKDYFYYGKHTTSNINDGYKGCGKKLRDYYKKYPNDYIKEIICFCNTEEELNNKEKEIISKYLNNKYCLNIAKGGDGGYIEHIVTEETRNKLSKSLKGHIVTKETREKISNANSGKNYRGKGWHHSDETKHKIGKLNSIKNKCHKVSDDMKNKLSDLYKNTKYMTLNKHTVRVKENEINHYLELGYHFGRK